jgi:hypothetical protein
MNSSCRIRPKVWGLTPTINSGDSSFVIVLGLQNALDRCYVEQAIAAVDRG